MDNTGILPPATVDSATYNGTQYAAPKNTNGGLLYYRSDLLPAAPKTWAELAAACEVAKTNNIDCYAGQFAPYEGLTVNTAEVINAYGGSFVGEDGKTRPSTAPRPAPACRCWSTTSRTVTSRPRTPRSRSPRARRRSRTARRCSCATGPMCTAPPTRTRPRSRASSRSPPRCPARTHRRLDLGGYNAAISAYSENKATARDFLTFLQGEQAQRIIAMGSLPPVRAALYDDPEIIAATRSCRR